MKAECLWCGKEVAAAGYTCNIRCYAFIYESLRLSGGYLSNMDEPPLDIYSQPWAADWPPKGQQQGEQ